MSFLNPLGLLGLIAIPILIIIYIIKNKYTEQLISSTYLWTLSERFLKRKRQKKLLTGLISLILQILAVTVISVSLAKPVFYLPGQAHDYLFVLDGSGSMNITKDGQTRFELGKAEIGEMIEASAKGSSYSLVYIGETTDKVFEGVTEKRRALSLLSELEVSHVTTTVTQALTFAQEAFAKNGALQVYFFTDTHYKTVENAQLVHLSDGEENYSVADVTCERSAEGLTVKGKLYSYESAASLDLALYVDGKAQPALKQTGIAVPKFDGENGTEFTLTCAETSYNSLKVVVENADALALDNETVVYNEMSDDTYTTLVVSDTSTFFVERELASFTNLKIYSWDVKTYEAWLADPASVTDPVHGAVPADFGLYIYNGYTPQELPKSSATWFFEPTETLAHTGFSVSDKQNFGNPPKEEVERGDVLNVGDVTYSASTASSVEELLANTLKDDDEIKVAYYARCDLVRDFRELLYCDNDPVLFAGINDYGNRQVVFAFDILDSNIATTFDFTVLLHNLVNYTFPEIVDETSYYSGESVRVNVPANCDSIRVETPTGKILYLDTSSDAAEFSVTEVGVHTVTLTSGVRQSQIKLYCNLPAEERVPAPTGDGFALTGNAEASDKDGIYDELMFMFIILAALFVADWMVYCYEQYQLR